MCVGRVGGLVWLRDGAGLAVGARRAGDISEQMKAVGGGLVGQAAGAGYRDGLLGRAAAFACQPGPCVLGPGA